MVLSSIGVARWISKCVCGEISRLEDEEKQGEGSEVALTSAGVVRVDRMLLVNRMRFKGVRSRSGLERLPIW